MVGRDAMVALEAFQSKDQWFKSLSVTFITLIPKNEGATEKKGLSSHQLGGLPL